MVNAVAILKQNIKPADATTAATTTQGLNDAIINRLVVNALAILKQEIKAATATSATATSATATSATAANDDYDDDYDDEYDDDDDADDDDNYKIKLINKTYKRNKDGILLDKISIQKIPILV